MRFCKSIFGESLSPYGNMDTIYCNASIPMCCIQKLRRITENALFHPSKKAVLLYGIVYRTGFIVQAPHYSFLNKVPVCPTPEESWFHFEYKEGEADLN